MNVMETKKLDIIIMIKNFSKVSMDNFRFYCNFRHYRPMIYVETQNIFDKFMYTMIG